MMVQRRRDGRSNLQMRDIRITYNVFEYAAGSVLLELGKTKILCAVTLQQGVPHFLKGKRVGWLTAEYAMLPASTAVRSMRESELGKKNGRNVEIARLIGRSLRNLVDLSRIGERTIIVDCDVLQADGGTRTACITAAGLALERAHAQWLAEGTITEHILQDTIAAISVGICKGQILVDLDFEEDSSIDADFNIVATGTGELVEVQGSAERCPYTIQQLLSVQEIALQSIKELILCCRQVDRNYKPHEHRDSNQRQNTCKEEVKVPFFSLKNRLGSGM